MTVALKVGRWGEQMVASLAKKSAALTADATADLWAGQMEKKLAGWLVGSTVGQTAVT